MKSPAFQFYPQDFLVGTADLSCEEVGAYIRLLCYQWAKGGLPNDDKKLMQLAGITDGYVMGNVSVKFRLCDDGLLRNDRLIKILKEQDEYHEKQRQNGKKGGNPLFEKGKHNPYYNPEHNRPLSSGDNPKINPSPSPSPSDNKEEESVASLPPLLGENSIPEETVQAGERALKAQRTSSKKNISKSQNLPIGREWCREYEKFHSKPYVWSYADDKAVSMLETAKISIEEMVIVMRSTWNNKHSFWFEKVNSISFFAKFYNDLRAASDSYRKKELKPSKPTGCFAEEES